MSGNGGAPRPMGKGPRSPRPQGERPSDPPAGASENRDPLPENNISPTQDQSLFPDD